MYANLPVFFFEDIKCFKSSFRELATSEPSFGGTDGGFRGRGTGPLYLNSSKCKKDSVF